MQFIIDESNNECPICLETINTSTNCATTECGHCFHTSCLIKHSVLTNVACPMCRKELTGIPNENDEYEDYNDSDSDTESDNDIDNDTNIIGDPLQRRTITQILSVMNAQNITNRHLVSALISTTYIQSWIDRNFIINESDDKEDEIMGILEFPVENRNE
jgi:hypothetical protein